MSLIIDDEYVGEVKTYLMEQCESVNDIKNKYIQTMQKVIETGIMEGTTAEALKTFLELIKCDLGTGTRTPWAMSADIERNCDNFITRVDKADKHIY